MALRFMDNIKNDKYYVNSIIEDIDLKELLLKL